MPSALRTAVCWCCRLEVPWSTQDVADMASCDANAVRAYLVQLAHRDVLVRLGDDLWRAGHPATVTAYRVESVNAKPGGGGRGYRRAKAARERLLIEEAVARRAGRLLGPIGPHADKPGQVLVSTEGTMPLHVGADLLGVSVKTLRRWAKRGLLALVRLPTGHHRVPSGEVVRLLSNRLSVAQATAS